MADPVHFLRRDNGRGGWSPSVQATRLTAEQEAAIRRGALKAARVPDELAERFVEGRADLDTVTREMEALLVRASEKAAAR